MLSPIFTNLLYFLYDNLWSNSTPPLSLLSTTLTLLPSESKTKTVFNQKLEIPPSPPSLSVCQLVNWSSNHRRAWHNNRHTDAITNTRTQTDRRDRRTQEARYKHAIINYNFYENKIVDKNGINIFFFFSPPSLLTKIYVHFFKKYRKIYFSFSC